MNEEKPHDRTGQPVVIPQREVRPQHFIIENDETESEVSVESRSFVNRVNDQVRKRQKRSSHEVILLDGTTQSVRNEETPRDRSGRPDVDSQEEARPQQFVIGNDETELELSIESRSFVNRVNNQV